MEIAILGAGAMGSVIGALLQKAGNQVTLIDIAQQTIEAVSTRGLAIQSKSGEQHIVFPKITDQPTDIGIVDLLIVFVKCYHTEAAVKSAMPVIGPDTVVLSLQNGWGNGPRIADLVGMDRVVLGVCYHSATILAPGIVLHAGQGKTFVGEVDGSETARLDKIIKTFSDAGIVVEPSGHVVTEIWSKLALNVATLPTSAAPRITADHLLDTSEMQELMKSLLCEVVAVANAQGVPIEFHERWEVISGLLRKLAPNTKGSMLQDVEHHRQTEIDVMCGAIVEAGTRFNIPTPYNRAMIGLIKGLEATFNGTVQYLSMSPLRFGVFGAGFWARYQISAWIELGGVECVALYNRNRQKAEIIAREFGISAVYDNPEELLCDVKPDFVDNITEIGGHKPLSILCSQHRVPCICQKPMASSLEHAREIVRAFAETSTPFFVHENWRWQSPMRALIDMLRSKIIGTPFRARLTMISGFDCWENQPALRRHEEYIVNDLGTHLLDTARACFGEATSLYCQSHRSLAPDVNGENVATLLLSMGEARTSVVIEMAFAKTPLERECFPQTLAFVEGALGSIEVAGDYWVRVTTKEGTHSQRYAPRSYAWADPKYDVAHASMVDCHRDLLRALRGGGQAETTGADNLKTVELVASAYESARNDAVVHFKQ